MIGTKIKVIRNVYKFLLVYTIMRFIGLILLSKDSSIKFKNAKN